MYQPGVAYPQTCQCVSFFFPDSYKVSIQPTVLFLAVCRSWSSSHSLEGSVFVSL